MYTHSIEVCIYVMYISLHSLHYIQRENILFVNDTFHNFYKHK